MSPTTTTKAAVIAALTAALLAGCSAQDPDTGTQPQPAPAPSPTEQTTAVTEDEGEEAQDWDEYVSTPAGRDEVLVAEQRAFNGGWRVYEADRWRAEEGCGCAEVDGGPELYPAGTQVGLYVVEFNPRQMTMNDQERLGEQTTWTLPDLDLEATYMPSGRSAVLHENGQVDLERINIDQIPSDQVAWGPQGLSGGQELKVEPGPGTGGVVWFAVAYWIDPRASEIELTLSGIVAPEQMPADHGPEWQTEILTVPMRLGAG